MSHHRRALAVVLVAVVLDAALGLLFAAAEHVPAAHGLYCGLANAVTVGCDIAPRTVAGYVVSALECSLVVPLFGAAFSLFTSGLTSTHVAASEKRVKAHLEERLREHLATQAGVAVTAGLKRDLAQVDADMTREAGRIIAAVEEKLGKPDEGSGM